MDVSIENKLLQEQLLQEAFLDSVKAYAQEKYNRVVDTIHDWKEAATVIGNVIANPTILQRFSDDVWYNFKRTTLSKLIAFLNKMGLQNFVTSINSVVTKITSLTGWQKFLAATGIGAIAEYVINKMAGLPADKITAFIKTYLSTSAVGDIITKLTDFRSYVGWLEPIIKGVEMLYAVLKNSISKFHTGIFANRVDLIKKENIDLKEYIKSLVRSELSEESTSGDAGAFLTPQAFMGKKKGDNRATKTANSQGMKKAPGMPKHSKVFDYKELWKGKKSAMNESEEFKVGDKVEYENQEWEIISFLANGTVRLKNLKGLPSANVIPSKLKMIKESDYDKASISSQASGYTAASGYTGVGGDNHPSQYYKEAISKKHYELGKDSKRFIPTEFEFPAFLLKPINIGNTSKIYFRIATSAKDESILMIDPSVAVALDAVERGRSSFDKEINLPALTRYIKEKIPTGARSLIKKAAQGAKIGENGFIALPLVLSKSPDQGTSVTNNKVSISEKGINLLKAIKADPTKGAGLENELGFLVWVYKHQNGTPKEYATDNGVSTQLASRLTNKSVANGTINMEKEETKEPTGDNWYIKNPFSGGEYKDINTKLYESVNTIVKEELLNESSYNRFKKEVSFRTKSEQLHKAIREVKRKLAEIDRIVEYTSRMKQELSEGEDGIKYWKATERNVATISEMVNHLNNKIKNLQQ
jgi:hypothetical protein